MSVLSETEDRVEERFVSRPAGRMTIEAGDVNYHQKHWARGRQREPSRADAAKKASLLGGL